MLAELVREVRDARNNEAEEETGRAKGGDNLTLWAWGKWLITACEECRRCNRLLLSGYPQRRKEMAL